MQPPPPPLNSSQLQELIAEADIIVVGKIDRVEKTEASIKTGKEITIKVILQVEKLLKGRVSGKYVQIKESYPSFNSVTTNLSSKENEEVQRAIISTRAGPCLYHGKYKEGARIIVLLKKIERANEYQLLGSGTYDQHLCEFLIENGGIKTLYFKFADDLEKYAQSEDKFTDLIKKLSGKKSSK